MGSLFHILKYLVIFYTLFLGIVYLFQRRLIYFPLKVPPSLGTLSEVYTPVQTQTKDNLTLTHWYARQNGLYSPHVVVLHGNAGNIEDRAYKFQFLVDQGCSLLLVSYRGYGDNPGKPTESNLIDDSALALEWLFKQNRVSPKDVVLFGESLGSGVAIALATKYPVRGLIFDGAYSSVTEVGQSTFPFVPVQWLLKDTWDSKSRILNVHSPILFIHSKNDSIIPFRFAEKLFQIANEPKKNIWLESSDHNDNLETETVRQSIIDFIQSIFYR